MKKGILCGLLIAIFGASAAYSQAPKGDVFQGKLFAPDIVLAEREALELSKQQFKDIRAAVLEVQSNVAEHEWDMREAYQALMKELERAPIDEAEVLEYANRALLAENQVKKSQITMLIRVRNLLTDEQIDYLETVVATQ